MTSSRPISTLLLMTIFVLEVVTARDPIPELLTLVDNLKPHHDKIKSVIKQASEFKQSFSLEDLPLIAPVLSELQNMDYNHKMQQVDVGSLLYKCHSALQTIERLSELTLNKNKTSVLDTRLIEWQIDELKNLNAELQEVFKKLEKDYQMLTREIESSIKKEIDSSKAQIIRRLDSQSTCNRGLTQKKISLVTLNQDKMNLEEKIKIQNETIDELNHQISSLDMKIKDIQQKMADLNHMKQKSPSIDIPNTTSMEIPKVELENPYKHFHFIFLLDVSIRPEQEGFQDGLRSLKKLKDDREMTEDLFSLILFNKSPVVAVKKMAMFTELNISQIQMKNFDNDIGQALDEAITLLRQPLSQNYTPIVILLTDGKRWVPLDLPEPENRFAGLIIKGFRWIIQNFKKIVNFAIRYFPIDLSRFYFEEVTDLSEGKLVPMTEAEVEENCEKLRSLYSSFHHENMLTFVTEMGPSYPPNLRKFVKAGNGNETILMTANGNYDFFNQAKVTNALSDIFELLSVPYSDDEKQDIVPQETQEKVEAEKYQILIDLGQQENEISTAELELKAFYEKNEITFRKEQDKLREKIEIMKVNIGQLENKMPSSDDIQNLADEIKLFSEKRECQASYIQDKFAKINPDQIKQGLKALEDAFTSLKLAKGEFTKLLSLIDSEIAFTITALQEKLRFKTVSSEQLAKDFLTLLKKDFLTALIKVYNIVHAL